MQESNASRVFLVAAVVLGILATVVAFTWLEKAGTIDKVPKVYVYVAKSDLRPNQFVDPAKDMTEVGLPAVPDVLKWVDRTLRKEDGPGYKGQRVNRPIFAGQIVMKADFAGQVTDTMAPVGQMRRISVPAKGANALGGNLVPGDYVELFVTKPKVSAKSTAIDIDPTAAIASGATGGPKTPAVETGSGSSDWEVQAVAPGRPMRVIAVGNRLARNRVSASYADHEIGGASEASATVTLEVTREEAMEILRMTGAGALPVTLVLCPGPAAAAATSTASK